MDPNACLKNIDQALKDRDFDLAHELSGYLNDWLSNGGFEPTWSIEYSPASSFYFETYPNQDNIDATLDMFGDNSPESIF